MALELGAESDVGWICRVPRRAYERATLIVRVYYALSIYWVITAIYSWPRYARLKVAEPLWPAAWWFDWVGVRTGVNLIFWAYLGAALIVMLVPEHRVVRAAYAFTLLQYMAFVNGFTRINHDMHSWLFVSIILVLLPRGPWRAPRRVADRQFFLTVIWTALLVVMLFYTLTGLWKVYEGVIAVAEGRTSGFNFSGFSYIVGERVSQTEQDPVLGSFLTRNELPGWALFTGTMYLETFSVVVAFRPRLHRLWGALLIAFHIGTALAMAFTFGPNIVLVGLLLVCSPLAPERIRVRDALLDLPVIHVLTRRAGSLHRRYVSRGKVGEGPPPFSVS